MAGPGNDYRRALARSRDMNRAAGRAVLRRMEASFAEALMDIARREAAGTMTKARATTLRRQILAALSTFEGVFAASTAAGIDATVGEVIRAHDEALSSVLRGASGIGVNFARVEPTIYGLLAARRGSDSFRSLYRHPFRTRIIPALDRMIGAAVTNGVGAGALSRDIATILAEGADPAVLARIPSTSTFHRRRSSDIDWTRYGLSQTQATAMREVYWKARQIAISEVNNTLRTANSVALHASPVVEAARWELSGVHPRIDDCDVLAEADGYDLGPGWYPSGNFPDAPHPNCGCHQGAVEFRDPSQWGTPKEPVDWPGEGPWVSTAARLGVTAPSSITNIVQATQVRLPPMAA